MKNSTLVILVGLIVSLTVLTPVIVFASRNNMANVSAINDAINDCVNGTNGHAAMHGSNWETHASQMNGEAWQNHMNQNMTQHHQQVGSSCH